MRIINGGSVVRILASARDTHDWATCPGKNWPCSTLAGHRIMAEYDRNGLCDITLDGGDASDVDGIELDAFVRDALPRIVRKVGAGHPVAQHIATLPA